MRAFILFIAVMGFFAAGSPVSLSEFQEGASSRSVRVAISEDVKTGGNPAKPGRARSRRS